MNFTDTPTLENSIVRLEALAARHASELSEAVAVEELWRTWYASVPSPAETADEIGHRLAQQHVVREASSGHRD